MPTLLASSDTGIKMDILLAEFRALDLTDEKGFLCGRILADLGAEVIKVERPGGDRSRNIGPFYHDIPDPEKSLYWFAFNANKKGITLNIESRDGRDIFRKVVEKVDFIIESFPVGYLDNLGLGYQELSQINPRLVMTSITPFGQDGPYKDYQASDLVLMAAGGYLYLTGDTDRAPVRISFPQAYLHGAAHAAVATLVAHYHRGLTGEGQHVDTSIQQSFTSGILGAPAFWELASVILKRAGQCRVGLTLGPTPRQTWKCKDGFVAFFIAGGVMHGKANRALVQWMDNEAMANDFMREKDWENLDMRTITKEHLSQIEDPISAFFLTHTKAELYEGGLQRGIDVYPVATVEDITRNRQLEERDYWVDIDHDELGVKIRYPGAPAKTTTLAQGKTGFRAPLVGEHNEEIYIQELGLSREQLIMLKQAGVV